MTGSVDGAHDGVGAADGMSAAMGADLVSVRRTPEELEVYIRANTTPPPDRDRPSEEGYEAAANASAVAVLDFLRAHPEARVWPANAAGEFRHRRTGERLEGRMETISFDDWEYVRTGPDLLDAVKAAGYHVPEGITGFRWGWAVNAAKCILGEPPVANPAIMTVERRS